MNIVSSIILYFTLTILVLYLLVFLITIINFFIGALIVIIKEISISDFFVRIHRNIKDFT